MRLTVTVKTRAKRPGVIRNTDGSYSVAVNAAPTAGQANTAVIKALAKHLGLAPSRLVIIRGAKDRRKVIEIQSD